MKKLLNIIVFLLITGVIAVVFLQQFIQRTSRDHMVNEIELLEPAFTGIVLGASVLPDQSLSPVLKARVDAAHLAYKQGKIKRFLLSGDHGERNYDEVNPMKDYLVDRGVPTSDIFLDHAGFDTYDSMIRAREIYDVNDAIVFTQEFHLPRAIYLGQRLGLDLQGYVADVDGYEPASNLKRREWLANIKAWMEININQRPTYAGESIPITGDSAVSYD